MARRVVLEEEVGLYARFLAEHMKPGVGFALVLFHFGTEGSMSYASNGQREETITMLQELLDKMRAETGA